MNEWMGAWMDGWVMGGWVMGDDCLAKWTLSMWSAVTGAEKCSGPALGPAGHKRS